MKIKFYGTRGSIPVCRPEYMEFGGNTTCLQVTFTDTNRIAILDAGTGIRNLGNDLLRHGHRQEEILIGFSHFHMDHIQGLPYFAPAYNPMQKIIIIALGKGRNIKNLKDIFSTQMQKEYFPLNLDTIGAKFEFDNPGISSHTIRETSATAIKHNHPGGAFTFRFDRKGKSFVFCTDIEHGDEIDQNVVELARGADLLIHDGQYTKEELKTRRGWGHSCYEEAIAVAEQAGVKRLIITHHDPNHNDEFLLQREKECRDRFKDCILAREGMEVEI